MYTLSCCCELTPFCRLPKYSLTSCLRRNYYSAEHWLLDVANGLPAPICVSTSANKPGSFDFTLHSHQPNDAEPINSLFFPSAHFWFIYSCRFFFHMAKCFTIEISVGRSRIKGESFWSCWLLIAWKTFEMVQMEIINLHIKCKKLVIL